MSPNDILQLFQTKVNGVHDKIQPMHQSFATTTRGLDRNLPPMRLYEKAKRLGIWNPSDIDLSKDKADWSTLKDDEKDLIMRLTDECSNKNVLPAFLTNEGGLNSGFMILQYTAAALATENKVLAHPASVDTIPTSANVEDHVSMGATSALKLGSVIDNVEMILSIELMAAAQGVDFRRQVIGAEKKLGRGTRGVYALIRQYVPFIEADTVMYEYIESMRRLVAEGKILP